MTDEIEHPDADLTVRQLGEQFGRGLAEADQSIFEAVLLGAADSLLQGMAEAGEDEDVAQAAVDQSARAPGMSGRGYLWLSRTPRLAELSGGAHDT